MVQFSLVLGLALYLYGIQTLFLCLTPTLDMTKVVIFQTVNQFAWNFDRWKT